MTWLNEVDTERNISMNFVGKIVLSSLSLFIRQSTCYCISISIVLYWGGAGENKREETTIECNRNIAVMSLNYQKWNRHLEMV